MTRQNHSLLSAPAPVMVRTLAALLVSSCFAGAQAAPNTPQVVNGQATFAQNGNVFSITNTPNTVINWQSFSVNAGDITRFIQQSSDSAVLNRIVGKDPSQILGALQSNGHVFLINPNGILFGRDARVDVNGLTASTLALSDADFLSGKKQFGGDAKPGARTGAVDNQGAITTGPGGSVFLIGANVDNSGIITSPQGQVVLAAGHTVSLADASNPSLHVVLSAPPDQSINLGQIVAQGGKVGIYGALVKQRAVVNANSAQVGENGVIVLRASREARLEAGSVTTATGAGRGGDISVDGETVRMMGDASIDASGATGGGSVLLGNNGLGKKAKHTDFNSKASIRADAIDSGDGGNVVLTSDGTTLAKGKISVRGGNAFGNGGRVETGGTYLDANGIVVQANAPQGINGNWLLAPFDLEIVGANGPPPGDDDSGDDDDGDDAMAMSRATLNASTISSVAPGTDVMLKAKHDVTFSHAINASLGSGAFTVEAGNSIFVNAAIGTGGGAIRMTANHPDHASGSGVIAVNAGGALDSGGGDVLLKGTQVTVGGPLTARGGNLTINADNMSLGATIRAGQVTLMPQRPGRQIAVGAGAADDADTLGLQDTELALMTARSLHIGAPEAQSGGITITPGGMDFSAILAADGELRLNGGSGDVILKGNLVTPGTLFIQGRHLQTAKGASATAPGIRMLAYFGIGGPGAPFATRTALLAAANQSANGEAPIYVANTGDLTLESVQQNGTGNQGSISVSNDGAMQVNAGTGNNAQAPNIVTGGKGSVTLTSNESLSILGDIATDSGAVELAAGNSGVLAIGAESSVSSKAGNIELGGVAVRNDGAVATATGDTHISAPTVSGDGTFIAPAGDVTGQAPGLPTLKVCIATPTAPGCMAVLPTLSACSAAPATEGCAVVLPTVAQCADSPTLQGCAPVLEPVTAARGNQLEKAVKVTINTLAQSKENVVERPRGDKDEEQNDIAPVAVASLQGEKNNAIPKTYCN